jgi:hypothetical protein
MFHDFFESPEDGKIVMKYNERYQHLKQRLAAVSAGDLSWVHKNMAADQKIKREIVNPTATQMFCKKWLQILVDSEDQTRSITGKHGVDDDMTG